MNPHPHLTGLLLLLTATIVNAQTVAEPRENTQKIEIGKQPGNVQVGNIVQSQSGRNNHQHISIGNAKSKGKGEAANVTVGNIEQTQKEGDPSDSQTIELGEGTHGDIIQNGSGTKKVEIGNP